MSQLAQAAADGNQVRVVEGREAKDEKVMVMVKGVVQVKMATGAQAKEKGLAAVHVVVFVQCRVRDAVRDKPPTRTNAWSSQA